MGLLGRRTLSLTHWRGHHGDRFGKKQLRNARCTLEGHSASVEGVALTRDGKRVVSASYDKTLNVWDLETGLVIATFQCDAARASQRARRSGAHRCRGRRRLRVLPVAGGVRHPWSGGGSKGSVPAWVRIRHVRKRIPSPNCRSNVDRTIQTDSEANKLPEHRSRDLCH
jgi:WD40 repeat protein